MLIFLYMITPTVKTNLILKEMGLTRYELRPKTINNQEKTIHIYQKGNILTLLNVSFKDLVNEEKKLFEAILNSIQKDNFDIVKLYSGRIKDLYDCLEKLTDIKAGGLGTFFIGQIMDEVVFKTTKEDWVNHLILTKRF